MSTCADFPFPSLFNKNTFNCCHKSLSSTLKGGRGKVLVSRQLWLARIVTVISKEQKHILTHTVGASWIQITRTLDNSNLPLTQNSNLFQFSFAGVIEIQNQCKCLRLILIKWNMQGAECLAETMMSQTLQIARESKNRMPEPTCKSSAKIYYVFLAMYKNFPLNQRKPRIIVY